MNGPAAEPELAPGEWPPLPPALVALPAAEVTIGLTAAERATLLALHGEAHAFDLAADVAALPAERWARPAMQVMATEVSQATWLEGPAPPGDCAGAPPVVAASRFPVTGVTPDEAERFCAARGMRLPSDREWEAIARGPTDAVAPVERVDTASYPLPVAARPAARTPEGVHDLAGSVREWVRCTPGEPAYCLGGFAQRGGAFGDAPIWWHPALAHPPLPGESARCHRAVQVGFRCVR
ncbi:MAG: SUMF1/EgtB/PvdO family nonheme iron enzyme [bacterium]